MTVKDNGQSFRETPENSAKRKQRLGLLGMQERVRLVNGDFAIHPQFGKGTTVQVSVPLKPVRSASRLQKLLRLSDEESTQLNSTT
jgi:nitrate/nitrite-specific signal transduction histidine kinase